MTLDEAIKHCEEVAEEKRYEYQECLAVNDMESAEECGRCGERYEQLVEWLKDYKKLLGAIEGIKTEITEPNEMDSLENSNLWQGWFLKLVNKHISGKEEE